MASPPSGNLRLGPIAITPGGTVTVEADVPSGFDLCGAQSVVTDFAGAGNIVTTLGLSMSDGDTATVSQQADFAAVPDGAVTQTGDGTATFGPTTGDNQQLLRIGHGRRIQASIAADAPVTAGTVTIWISAIGTAADQPQS